MTSQTTLGTTKGGPKIILRLEGLAVLITMLFLYQSTKLSSWSNFALFFLLPDLGMIGYLYGKKFGAFSYNLTHTYLLPLLLGGIFLLLDLKDYMFLNVIWIAHIGFDRALGFGLKYGDSFYNTHLGIFNNKEKSK